MDEERKVLVVEPCDQKARKLEELVRRLGYEPVVHIAPFGEEIRRWIGDPNIVAVVTYYLGYPFLHKRQELQDIVDMERPGLPVFAFTPNAPASLVYFEAEFHSGNDFNLTDLPRIVAEHLRGACVVCAQYRS